jgi:ABC-type bacteriocin/lantibiotic exporter with double-glycine peptidase domain
MGLASSVASKYLVDAVTGYGTQIIGSAALIMVCMMLGSVVLQAFSSWVGARVNIRVRNGMQLRTYGKILRASWQSLEAYRSGDLLNRLNSDINAVSGNVISFLPSLLASGAKFLGAFLIMLFYDPVMALIAMMAAPLTLVLSALLVSRLRRHNLIMKELGSEVMSFQEESFWNLTSIKAFSAVDRYESEMDRIQQTYADAYLDYNTFRISMSSLLSLLSMGVTASCFGWGVYRLWSGRITYGSLTLFLELAGTLRGSFSSLVSLAQQAVSLTTSAGRILAVEALPAEQKAVPDGLLQETGLNMELSQVSFRYCTGETVLEPFAFTANHGDLIAVTGPSGEGKTTLLRLLLGLVEPDTGRAELVGSSGKRYPLDAGTRQVFAYVPQGSSVFSGTIAENLRLVRPDASEEELEEVLRIACAWEFVNCLPGGLHHRLGAGGRGVSEGQAQRLAIARALLRRAPVLLLDEATSGLDIATERKLMKNLKESGRLQTCILVTHRPESARFCNRTYEIRRRHVTEVTDEA